jgi:hypothetical protein
MRRNKPTKARRLFARHHATRTPNARNRRALLSLYRAAWRAQNAGV